MNLVIRKINELTKSMKLFSKVKTKHSYRRLKSFVCFSMSNSSESQENSLRGEFSPPVPPSISPTGVNSTKTSKQDNFSTVKKTHDVLVDRNSTTNSWPSATQVLKQKLSKIDKVNFTSQTKYYTSYSKLSEIKLVTIGIASPLRILQWAEKTLPNGKVFGEVLNANTLHHKTFKPQIGGLFCERIFGPLKDFECACENTRMNKLVKQDLTKNMQKGSFPGPDFGVTGKKQIRKYCPKCDVEYTWSVIRRYQLGYIKLSSPVTHIWFLKGTPSYLSLLLDMKKRHLQLVTYCSETLTLENSLSNSQKSLFLDSPSQIFASWEGVITASTRKNVSSLMGSSLTKLASTTESQPGTTLPEVFPPPVLPFGPPASASPLNRIPEGSSLLENSMEKISKGNLLSELSKTANQHTPFQLNQKKKALARLNLKPNAQRTWQYFSSSTTFADKELNKNEKNFQENNANLFKHYFVKQISHSLEKVNNSELNSFSKINNINSPLQKLQKVKMNGLPLLFNSLQLSLYYSSFNKKNGVIFKSKQKNEVSEIEKRLNLSLSVPVVDSLAAAEENSRSEFSQSTEWENSKKIRLVGQINRILKKLPIDFYILCILENRLHKKFITYSIKKAWERLYKKAFMTALSKMIKVYAITLRNQIKKPLETHKPETKESLIAIKSNSVKSSAYFMNFKTSAKDLTTLLRKLKNSYKNHVFRTLQKIKQPVFLLNYTTSIDNSSLEIISQATNEMDKFLSVDTNFLVTLFRKSLEKQLLINKLININTEMNKDLKLNNLTSIDISMMKKSILSYNKKLNQLKTDLKLIKQNEPQTIKQFENQIKTSNFKEFYKKLIPLELALTAYAGQSIQPDNKLSNFRFGFSSINKNTQLVSSNVSSKGKSLYNNVYTLSHRERWESEKDWQIFLLYNSGSFSKINNFPNFEKYQDSLFKEGKQSGNLNRTKRYSLEDLNDFPIFSYCQRISQVVGPDSLMNEKPVSQKSLNFNKIGSFNVATSLPESSLLSNAFFSGPGIIQQLLHELTFPELKKLDKQNRLLLYQLNQNIIKLKKQVKIFVYDKSAQMELKDLCKKRDLLIRRTKLVRKLFRKDSDPSSMILTVLPVLPPDLRPIVKMGSQIAASDLNRLYQQVIYRNERLKFFLKDPATSHSYEMKYAQRLLQEAVDNLIQNSKSGTNSEKDARGRSLKSLSDVLKGKQGRFRQFLLGKRVDYSGRSVIVVGPKLKLHECGIPLEMALELFLPFLLKRILNKNYAKTVIGAKSLIQNNIPLAHELLREIMQISPVLLNRAPTLHRLGIQAFVPKLVEGRAILLHPLVCAAFNADFDGDQMAVHVPITIEARAEAWKLMLARNNILSPATGDPLAIPSQDMVLGCYYLTTYSKSLNQNRSNKTNEITLTNQKLNFVSEKTASIKNSGILVDNLSRNKVSKSVTKLNEIDFPNYQNFYFQNLQEVINAYNQQKLKVHTLVWVKWMGLIENGNDQEEPIEIRMTQFGQWQEISSSYHRFYDKNNSLITQYMATTPGRILFNLIIQST